MKPLVLVPQHFGSLLFDRRRSRYLPFDVEATRVLRALIETPLYRLPDEPALASLVEQLRPLGMIGLDSRLDAAWLDVEPPADHLTGPLAVHLEVIASCDLTCGHCFAGPLPRRGRMSVEQIARLCGELAAMGSFRLGLTGGEPLLRPDLLEIIDAATDAGLHPCLTTNGLQLDARWARELGRRELLWLNVSLDGASAATNDAIRGAGTFERVRDKLRLLADHARFTLAFTVTSLSAPEVEDCARLAREVGAHTAVFRPLYPVGQAAGQFQLMPSYPQYADALERLEAVMQPDEDLHAIDPFSPQVREARQARSFVGDGCGAANLIASISVAGEVSPCSFLGPSTIAGRLDESSFAEIWHRSPGFVALRQLGQQADRAGRFQGGCRARAQAAHGDLDAPDPWFDDWQQRRAARHPSTVLSIDGAAR